MSGEPPVIMYRRRKSLFRSPLGSAKRSLEQTVQVWDHEGE